MIEIKDLVSCEWCGVVLDKNFLSAPKEPLNDYNCPVYVCPLCSGEVIDYEKRIKQNKKMEYCEICTIELEDSNRDMGNSKRCKNCWDEGCEDGMYEDFD